MPTPIDLLYLLIGDAQAIRAIAQNPHSLWIGFLLTISAGLARHYDHTDHSSDRVVPDSRNRKRLPFSTAN